MVISRSLRGGKYVIQDGKGNTYKTKSVCAGALLDVFRQIPIGHPFRNKLERSGSHTEERDDVFVLQVFPQYGRLVECLWISSAMADREYNGIIYFYGLLRVVLGINPNTFNANP